MLGPAKLSHDTKHPNRFTGGVAVLVDCDNTSPEVLEHALKVVAQFGRVVLRRGYGNHATLANKWQEALVRLAFTPDTRPVLSPRTTFGHSCRRSASEPK